MRTEGKSFLVFCGFLDAIKKGKKVIMFGPGYVVLEKNSYDTLIQKPENKTHIEFWEESGKIGDETWVKKFFKEAIREGKKKA